MIVTSAPKDFQTVANSTPMTPPPRTSRPWGRSRAERLLGGDHAAADLQAGQRLGVGAGGEDNVLALVRAVAVDLDGVLRRRACPTPSTTVDLAGGDQTLQALELAGDDAHL